MSFEVFQVEQVSEAPVGTIHRLVCAVPCCAYRTGFGRCCGLRSACDGLGDQLISGARSAPLSWFRQTSSQKEKAVM